MDWHEWIDQRVPFTEIMRGGATVWPAGGTGLIGDSLGPVMHSHEKASEIFYFISGRCRLEIGNSEEFFNPGEFVLVPPEVPHNLWNAGDGDLWVFWIVAPNFITNKWITEVPTAAMKQRAMRSLVKEGVELPSDQNIQSRILPLVANQVQSRHTGERQEAIVYLLGGQADVQVGKVGGKLGPNEFVHVPWATNYSVVARGGPASVLIFEMTGA